MVALPVYDLLLCTLIIAKGMSSFRYGLETSLTATIIRHDAHTVQPHRTYSYPIKRLYIVLSRDWSNRDHNIGHMGARKRHRRGSLYVPHTRPRHSTIPFQNRMAAVRNSCTQLQLRELTND